MILKRVEYFILFLKKKNKVKSDVIDEVVAGISI
jgi:hypothetical protein